MFSISKFIVIMCLYNGPAAVDYLQCTENNEHAVNVAGVDGRLWLIRLRGAEELVIFGDGEESSAGVQLFVAARDPLHLNGLQKVPDEVMESLVLRCTLPPKLRAEPPSSKCEFHIREFRILLGIVGIPENALMKIAY
ncbi:hypothetical protein NQ318_015314 [Aromia moschata]|uniref:Uncharacterized protein n=1 Tax=Aromia moschata TaxID=1265417 RepID=A0AAV8XXM2_9CUCU|nr:hypothetical protein NQ318_015314 [Aromia moschata]